jgi:hypothetical protein
MKAFIAFLIGGLLVWTVMIHRTVLAPVKALPVAAHSTPPVVADRSPTALPAAAPPTPPMVTDRAPTFQEQLQCAAETERQYKRGGYTDKDMMQVMSHYSPRLGHCYGMFSITSYDRGAIFMTFYVFDAAEGSIIGRGLFRNSEWVDGKEECTIDTPTGDTKLCENVPQFEDIALELYGLKK